jgi:hypothetical protein
MANKRKLPDVTVLAHWVNDEGLTHQEIADRVYEQTGNRVSRSTVSAALSRAGLSKPGPRYDYLIPWKVNVAHSRQYPVRMLRTLGRWRELLPLREGEQERLDSWAEHLDKDGLVVAYDPNVGFVYTKRELGDPMDAPIRCGYVAVVG